MWADGATVHLNRVNGPQGHAGATDPSYHLPEARLCALRAVPVTAVLRSCRRRGIEGSSYESSEFVGNDRDRQPIRRNVSAQRTR